MTRKAGHCHFWGGEVTRPEDVAILVDRVAGMGARTLKLMVSGGGLTPGTSPSRTELPKEYVELAVTRAAQAGLRVTAHCHATSAIRSVVAAGVSMIEHAGFVEDDGSPRFDADLALRIRDQGIRVGPTVVSAARTAARYRRQGRPSNSIDAHAVERLEARRRNAARFLDLELDVIAGSDAGVTDTPFDALIDELILYASMGARPAQVLRTATSNAAKALGVPAKGSIRIGLDADIVLLRENPLVRIEAIKSVEWVIYAGAAG
jgi:imidazolonepropionase-like amidohydrolase